MIKKTKATMHRGSPRVWLQGAPEMTAAGFTAKARYSITYNADNITLIIAADGKRGVSDCARGAVLDIGGKKLRAYDFTGGVNWQFMQNKIVITQGVKLC